MTAEEAARRLVFHARPEAGSFLEMLRPYRGVRDEVLRDVLAALRAASANLEAEKLPRELVSSLWAISRLGRAWALEPGGMLRRNHLISNADQGKLAAFLDRFDYAVMVLLEGGGQDAAFPPRDDTLPIRHE